MKMNYRGLVRRKRVKKGHNVGEKNENSNEGENGKNLKNKTIIINRINGLCDLLLKNMKKL